MSMRSNTGEVKQGAEVLDANGDKVGKVVEVGRNSFKVEKGFIFHKDMHLPLSAVAQADGRNVRLRVAKDKVMTMGAEQLPAEDHAWYGTSGTDTGRTTERGRTGREGETKSVPIIEEELKAGVREKQGGTARIVKDVREEQQSIDVPVQHEEVYVTERAVNRPATKEDLAAMDRDIEIPLKQQEVVTQKQAVCRDDVCQFSSSEDEPLSFSFSSKDRTITVAFGEGSQSGPLTLVESGEAIAVVSLLGPVQQGGKSLGGRNELFVAQIDKKTKNFFVKRSAEMLKGTCE